MWLPKSPPWSRRVNRPEFYEPYAEGEGLCPQCRPGGAKGGLFGGLLSALGMDTAFSIKGQPDDTTFNQQVETHEGRHANDNKVVHHQILARWDRNMQQHVEHNVQSTGPGEDGATAALYRDIGGSPDHVAAALWRDWDGKSRQFHQTHAGRTPEYVPGANSDCSQGWLKYRY